MVAEALAGNDDRRAAAARVGMAAAQARSAGAPLQPQLSAGGSGSRRKQNFVGFPIPGGPGGGMDRTVGHRASKAGLLPQEWPEADFEVFGTQAYSAPWR